MQRIIYFAILIFLPLTLSYSQNSIELQPIILSRLDSAATFTRSIYDIDARFSNTDTVIFLEKEIGLEAAALDSVAPNELSCTFAITPSFCKLGPRQFYIVDSKGKRKTKASLNILWGPQPTIHVVKFSTGGISKYDTLTLSPYVTTPAKMTVSGYGLFNSTSIEFDDPAIQVIDDLVHRRTYVPDSLVVDVAVNTSKNKPRIGVHRLLLRNPYAQEAEHRIVVRGAFAPKITRPIKNFIANGTEHKLTIYGSRFARGCSVATIPVEKNARLNWVSENKVELFLTMPILERNANYRLVVTNPDGQADTSGTFIVMPKPLASARLKRTDAIAFFLGKKIRAEFVVATTAFSKLFPDRIYEIDIEGQRFVAERVKDDSTLIAVIRVSGEPTQANAILKNFSIAERGKMALWKGSLEIKVPPELTYLSKSRIVHPVDTLTVLLKGNHLKGVSASIDDPEVEIRVETISNEIVRLLVIAGKRTTPGDYPLTLRKNGVSFRFDDYKISVRNWLQFDQFVGIQVGSLGQLSPSDLWSGSGISHHIEASDQIIVIFFASKIPPEYGEQKVIISGMLTDSVSTVRAEAIDKQEITLEPGSDIITWRFRVRQEIRSADRIEISLQNPGGQNRVMEFFTVEPYWFEFFHGSASLILFKIPFGGGSSTTEILRSAAFGLSWQPWRYSKFVEFDMSFIVGNVATAEDNISVEVGLGLSAILWNHLQVGFGTNLTGDSFTEGFTFVATRFRLPIPWKP